MLPNPSDEVIDPTLDPSRGTRDDLQGQRSLSRPERQPLGSFDQLAGSTTTNNTSTIIEASRTARDYRTGDATNGLKAHREEIEDESHTLTPSHELPTPHPSAAGWVNASPDSDPSQTASKVLEKIEELRRCKTRLEATTSMAGAVEADEQAQENIRKAHEIASQTVSHLLVLYIERHLGAN